MKSIFISVINFFIFFLMLILIVIMSIKSVTVDTIYTTGFTNEIKQSITQSYPEIKNIDELDMKKIIEKYINMITNNEEINITPEIKDVIDKYNLTNEQKQEIISKVNEHNDEIVTQIKEKYTPTENQQLLIDVYNYLNSKVLKTILFVIIIISFIVMLILQKSLYKWMLRIGMDLLLIGGALIMLLPEIINKISHMKLSVVSLTNEGGKYASIGLFLLTLYLIIEYIVNATKKKKAK